MYGFLDSWRTVKRKGITQRLLWLNRKQTLHKKWNFPLRTSSANVSKSAVSRGFANIYGRNPYWKTSFFRKVRPPLEGACYLNHLELMRILSSSALAKTYHRKTHVSIARDDKSTLTVRLFQTRSRYETCKTKRISYLRIEEIFKQ